MKLGVDVDGILADFNPAYIERIKLVTGRDLFGADFIPTVWNYPEAVGYTKKELRAVWDHIKADRHFWLDLEPYPETAECMKDLRWRSSCGDALYFITARPGDTTKRQTEGWLIRHFGLFPTVLMSGDKGGCATALQLDHYIDDRFENAVAVGATKTRSYLLSRPWNAQFCTPDNVTRVTSMDGFFNRLA